MNRVTMGGLILGIGLIVHHLILWYPGYKSLRKDAVGQLTRLLPFAYGWCYGALAILCVGGLVGSVADVVLWGSNWLGDTAYVWGVGGEFRTDATRPAVSALTVGGNAVMLLLTIAWLALLKRSDRLRGDLLKGAWAGILTALAKGVAGVAAVPLASAVNVAGAWLSTRVLV